MNEIQEADWKKVIYWAGFALTALFFVGLWLQSHEIGQKLAQDEIIISNLAAEKSFLSFAFNDTVNSFQSCMAASNFSNETIKYFSAPNIERNLRIIYSELNQSGGKNGI